MAYDIGRICVKIAGREAGRKCIIIDKMDKNYVLITGPPKVSKVKRRRANMKQLEPTMDLLKIKKGISDEDLIKLIENENKLEFMKERIKIQV
ncbi:MAG: 50S ribosomal protein L14e [Candidatus Lokiarchaeota archaeon]|nr:50S ribosomal protein L14e [Candidatus Lokiarchaeota archaeon]